MRRAWSAVSVLLLALASGCGRDTSFVVVYAAQDRVHAEPILQEFQRLSGIEVRAVYDNEATKTAGLANRLLMESRHPQADVWWSNEEMHTRQLARRGSLGADWTLGGRRHRVLVIHTNATEPLTFPLGLASFTNTMLRGRIALAYPLFGTTATHLLVLRQRWGERPWRAWCEAVASNRPLLVDGNSVVVRLVASGEALVGLTDSDDVAFGQREGLPVVRVPLPPAERLSIPNSVAIVTGAPHGRAAGNLARYLQSPQVRERLVSVGALDADDAADTLHPTGRDPVEWDPLLDDLDASLRELQTWFAR